MKEKKWYICILCTLIFILLAILIKTNNIQWLDDIGYRIVYPIGQSLDGFFRLFTHLGSPTVLIAISVISLVVYKFKGNGLASASNLIIIYLLNTIIKKIVARPRPVGINLITEHGFSFPSGHAMIGSAVYGLLLYFILKSNASKTVKTVCSIIIPIVIILIGMTRIYLGVHFTSDILAGWMASIVELIIFTTIYENKTRS